MIHYYLRPTHKQDDNSIFLKKISDYFLTFIGDIEVKIETEDSIIIYYVGTPTVARLHTEKTNQITITVSADDNLTINLINNIAKNIDIRIYNPQTNCYLPNDINILDLTTIRLDPSIKNVLNQYQLIPLFQYRDTLIFFCKNQKNEIVLVNRHYLEYVLNTKPQTLNPKEFSTKVADNISQFIALFDRGLISLTNPDTKIINLSGFNLQKLPKNTELQVVNFIFDEENQNFIQTDTTDKIPKKYLALKVGQDYNYRMVEKKLTKFLNVSVFHGA